MPLFSLEGHLFSSWTGCVINCPVQAQRRELGALLSAINTRWCLTWDRRHQLAAASALALIIGHHAPGPSFCHQVGYLQQSGATNSTIALHSWRVPTDHKIFPKSPFQCTSSLRSGTAVKNGSTSHRRMWPCWRPSLEHRLSLFKKYDTFRSTQSTQRSNWQATGTMRLGKKTVPQVFLFPGDPPKHPPINENRLLFASVFTFGMPQGEQKQWPWATHARHSKTSQRTKGKENKPCGFGRDYDLVFGCCLLNVLQFNQGTLKSIDKDSIEAHRLHQSNPPGVPKALPFLIIVFTTCWDVSLTRECQRCRKGKMRAFKHLPSRKERMHLQLLFSNNPTAGCASVLFSLSCCGCRII